MGKLFQNQNVGERIKVKLIIYTIESLLGKYLGINPSRANYR